MKVAIVDDEILTQRLLLEGVAWRELGYEIAGTAANGAEAVDLLLATEPDLCILDIRMPRLNGLEVLQRIRGRGLETEIIILSAYGEFEYARQALRHGAFSYLLKPIDDEDMRRAILDATAKIRRKRPDPDLDRPAGADGPVRRAVAFIERHYRDKVSLDDICAEVNMSKTHFCRLYKRERGESIWDSLTALRIRQAERLLTETDLRIFEIAEQIGFENATYFATVFKKRTGQTPQEYRLRRGGRT